MNSRSGPDGRATKLGSKQARRKRRKIRKGTGRANDGGSWKSTQVEIGIEKRKTPKRERSSMVTTRLSSHRLVRV